TTELAVIDDPTAKAVAISRSGGRASEASPQARVPSPAGGGAARGARRGGGGGGRQGPKTRPGGGGNALHPRGATPPRRGPGARAAQADARRDGARAGVEAASQRPAFDHGQAGDAGWMEAAGAVGCPRCPPRGRPET